MFKASGCFTKLPRVANKHVEPEEFRASIEAVSISCFTASDLLEIFG